MCRTPLVSWELSHKMLCVMSLLIVWQVVSPWREYGSLHVTSHSQSWLRYTTLALGLPPSMFSPAGHPQLLAFSEQLHGGKTLCWLLGALQRGVRRHLCHLQGVEGLYCRWKALASVSLFVTVSSTGGVRWEHVCWQCHYVSFSFWGSWLENVLWPRRAGTWVPVMSDNSLLCFFIYKIGNYV